MPKQKNNTSKNEKPSVTDIFKRSQRLNHKWFIKGLPPRPTQKSILKKKGNYTKSFLYD